MEYPTSHLYLISRHTLGIRSLNFVGSKIAAQDGKFGFKTIEYTTAFLCSDWLYFLWHGINDGMEQNKFCSC